jgi:hypothetical protein
VEAFKALKMQGEIARSRANDHLAASPSNVGRTPIGDALYALIPWSADPCGHDSRRPFPGLHGFVRGLTGGRASIRAVQRWASGSRKAPDWFVQFLDAELSAREHAMSEARRNLATYQFGRGNGAGLRDSWRDKRNAEIEAARRNRFS